MEEGRVPRKPSRQGDKGLEVCSTASSLLLALAGLLLAFYGVVARRSLSAIALATTTYSVAIHLLGLAQLWERVPPEAVALLLSVVGFIIGFFSYRLAVSISTGYATFVLILKMIPLPGLPLDVVYAVSVATALATYLASLRRVYVPYVVLGAITLAIALSTLTHGVVAITVAILVGIAGCVVQGSSWRAKMKLVKQRSTHATVKQRKSKVGRGPSV